MSQMAILWGSVALVFHALGVLFLYSKKVPFSLIRIMFSIGYSAFVVAFLGGYVLLSVAVLTKVFAIGIVLFLVLNRSDFLRAYLAMELVFVGLFGFNQLVLETLFGFFGTNWVWILLYFLIVGIVVLVEFYLYTVFTLVVKRQLDRLLT